MRNSVKGAIVATAVAAMFSMAFAGDAASQPTKKAPAKKAAAKIHCMGVNSCKGQGACASADNSCKGQNSCKGKAWIETTAKQCTDQKGTIMKDEKKETEKKPS